MKKKIYSGCEYVAGRDRENVQLLARGRTWRTDFGGPGGVLNRRAFKVIEFPDNVTIKKIDG